MSDLNTHQQEQGWMVYPTGGWRRVMFKAPLYAWRMGLGRLLPSNFMVLTTTGRKSGQPRHTMVETSQIQGRFYLGSGWGQKPQWFQNLRTNPLVTVQTVREGTISGKASIVTDADELAMVYHHARGKSPVWKDYLASWGIEDTVSDFVAKRDRIPTIRIDPIPAATPPPLPTDLLWVWPLLGLLGGMLWVLRRRTNKRHTPPSHWV